MFLKSHFDNLHSGNIAKEKVESHLERLRGLKWNHFKGHPQLQASLQALRSDLLELCAILCDKRDALEADLASKKPAAVTPCSSKKKKVPIAFGNKNTVQLTDNTFYTEIDKGLLPRRQKKKAKSTSPFRQCVKESVSSLLNKLRRTSDYKPMFVTDEDMAIDEYAEVICQKPFLAPQDRARFRALFRDELSKGADGMCIAVWGQMKGGTDPDNLFVWKFPTVQPKDHAGTFSFLLHLIVMYLTNNCFF